MLSRTNSALRGLRRRPARPEADTLAALSAEGPAVPGPVLAPAPGSAAALRSAKRRRDIFRGLGLALLCTLLLAVAAGSGYAWALQILVDVVAIAYVALWWWARSVQAERADKIRYMPELRVPELALRRSASS